MVQIINFDSTQIDKILELFYTQNVSDYFLQAIDPTETLQSPTELCISYTALVVLIEITPSHISCIVRV